MSELIPVTHCQWNDLSVQIGMAVYRDISMEDYSENFFDGVTEADLVYIISNIMSSSGYKCYLEWPYPNCKSKVDIRAVNWEDETIYCEAKVLYVNKDNRLKKQRYDNKKEILKDIENIHDVNEKDKAKIHGLVVHLAFSESDKLDFGSTEGQYSLQKIIDDINEKWGERSSIFHYSKKVSCCTNDTSMYKYMHVYVATLRN